MSNYQKLVVRSLQALAETDGIEQLREVDLDTRLFGTGGALDSASMVFLVTEIEEAASREFGVDIALVDEKAFARRSPFRTVGSLVSYLEDLVNEAKCAEKS